MTHPKFWRPDDHLAIKTAVRYVDLTTIAVRIIRRIPKPIGLVCGPISTGGLGSTEKNLEIFEQTIETLTQGGRNIFNQIPFEETISFIKRKVKDDGAARLMEEFYRPIFESGLIGIVYFIHRWEASVGARWEHNESERLGLSIFHL